MAQTPDDNASLAERLGETRVGLRSELEFSRHTFRGEVSYIVRDPISFDSHRVSLADYQVLVHIREDRRLCEIFDTLVEKGVLVREREEAFYRFIITLHQRGFIQLQLSDPFGLHQLRYELVLSARSINTDFAATDNLQSILGCKTQPAVLSTKYHGPHLALLVLQCKIAMPGRRNAHI